jgi:hypothetical protein
VYRKKGEKGYGRVLFNVSRDYSDPHF